MTEPEDFIEQRLKHLAEATEQVGPTAGFDDWIIGAVQEKTGLSWFDSLWRAGRVALVAGTLAAAASVLLAVHMRGEADDAVLNAFELVELDE